MQLHHYQRLVEARQSGRTVRIRTLSGRVLCGRVEAVAANASGADLIGQVILETADNRAESLDLSIVLAVVVAEPPLRNVPRVGL